MTFVVLFILAVVWALYLASWLRSRAHHRSRNSISSFSRHLLVLDRTRNDDAFSAPALSVAGRQIQPRLDPLVRPPQVHGLLGGAPITRQDAQRRRRDVLLLLGGLTAVGALAAVTLGGIAVWFLLIFGAVTAGFVFLLVRGQRLADERAEKVRYLPQSPALSEQTLALQRLAR